MKLPQEKWLRLGLGVAICIPAAWQLWLLGSVFVGRYDYPFDIDWLESSALYQAWRMMEGQFTYSSPDRGYLPLFHPIGYPALLAAVGKIAGLDYAVARLVSIIAFGATVLIGGYDVVRHADDRISGALLAVLGAGLAAACLPLSGGFYDMVRNDTVSWLCCAVAASIATSRELKHKHIIAIAVVMVLGVYIRLLTVFPSAWIGLVILWRDRRAGMRLAAYVLGGCGVVLGLLQWMSEGWYFTYTVTLLQHHTVHADRLWLGTTHLLEFLPFLPVLLVAAGVLGLRKDLGFPAIVWAGVLGMSVPASLLPFGKDGGFYNDFMPIGLYVGPALALVVLDGAGILDARPRFARLAPLAIGAATAGFLLLRPFDVGKYVPSEEQLAKAHQLNEMVAGLEGGVLVPCHPFLPIRNGHRNPQYSEMPYLDVHWAGLPGLDLGSYIDRADATWVMLTGFEISLTVQDLVARYEHGRGTPHTPPTLVGEPLRIKYLLKRKGPRENVRVLFDFEDELGPEWTRIGVAFERTPSTTHPKGQNPIVGATGVGLVNSFHPTLFDRAVGRLESPPFYLDGDYLAVDVGGGVGVGMHLLVEGEAVAGAYPVMFNKELLLQLSIDVREHRGKEAQVVFYDDNTGLWGHVVADQVMLYDVPAKTSEREGVEGPP